MKSSVTSSTTTTPSPPSATPSHSAFALTGPSVTLDPAINAVRRDLADVRLADKVFAPHYVQPLAMTATVTTPVLATAAAGADEVSLLELGDIFDVLEIANTHSWGQRRADRMVGYVANDALTPLVVTDDAA